MTILRNANKRKMIMHGAGRSSHYVKVPMKMNGQCGKGIIDGLGKAGTKAILGSLGKNVGSYGGKQIAKFIQDKTGSELAGKVAKAALSSIGSFGGQKLGQVTGKVLSNAIFSEPKKKKEEKVSLTQLMDRARERLTGNQQGQGISLIRKSVVV